METTRVNTPSCANCDNPLPPGVALPLCPQCMLLPATGDDEASPDDSLAGTLIGNYQLIEQIGEGGFGVVYLAEQLEPVKRQVALKVIKPGMDSRRVVARFEAERQVLALLPPS